ncbi:hypothetical protein BZA70DRAFT_278855 [Myxozyma melibiosi]|uniref:Uncharacterized protein n=1 Tax=Myxozyma melibiosi TaxID=54550 RepID=A0ABR1F5A0_9ASCO
MKDLNKDRTVRRISLEEFQQRCASTNHNTVLEDESFFNASSLFTLPQLSSSSPSSSSSSSAPASSLRQRIEQQKIRVANTLIERYEKLFFSDNVDPRSTPIQRFLPEPLYDPAAHGAAPTPTFDSSPPSSPLAALGSWCRELRRSMFLESQGARTKVWDHFSQEPAGKVDQIRGTISSLYDRLSVESGGDRVLDSRSDDFARAESNSKTASELPTGSSPSPSSSSTSPSSATTPSPSASPSLLNVRSQTQKPTAHSMLLPLNFADRAYPSPNDAQLKNCMDLAGKGVWDSFGVWRCLLPNHDGSFPDFNAPGRTRLFEKYDDYLHWRMLKNQDLQKTAAVESEHVDDVFDRILADTAAPTLVDPTTLFASLKPFISVATAESEFNKVNHLRKVDKPAPDAKLVGQSEAVTQSYDHASGKTSTVRTTRKIYSDNSVVEEVVRDEK